METPSQTAERHSTSMKCGQDINGNDIVMLGFKCHEKLQAGSMPLKTERRRRPLQKRRSSLTLECEGLGTKRPGFPGLVEQAVRKIDAVQTPGTVIGNFIANVLIGQHRSQSCSSISSSPSSSDCEVEEELICPVRVCGEEATHMYSGIVRNWLTKERWIVTDLGDDQLIQLSYDDDEKYELITWDVMGSGFFVFGFRDSGSTYYVRAPESDNGYLFLTSGDDPQNITNPSEDPRCFYYHSTNHTGTYLLSSAKHRAAYVVLKDEFALALDSVSNAMSWTVKKE